VIPVEKLLVREATKTRLKSQLLIYLTKEIPDNLYLKRRRRTNRVKKLRKMRSLK
tara:strand:- start:169 stop:333 length:165 start_codon:yes stop_codon:yes gene_type:complete